MDYLIYWYILQLGIEAPNIIWMYLFYFISLAYIDILDLTEKNCRGSPRTIVMFL